MSSEQYRRVGELYHAASELAPEARPAFLAAACGNEDELRRETALMAEEFDLSFFQDRPLDHGCFSPLSLLWPHQPDWPGRVVPLHVGVVQFPLPTARRCFSGIST